MNYELKDLIKECDRLIKNEKFEELMKYYAEDAILVVKPGMEVKGRDNIKNAFIKIAEYFKNSIVPTQGEMIILETGDTALVLSQTFLSAPKKEDSEYSMERKATYVFKKDSEGSWQCVIDNSYGTDLLNK